MQKVAIAFSCTFLLSGAAFCHLFSLFLLEQRDLSTHGNKNIIYFRAIYGRSQSAKLTTARTKPGERFRSSGKFQLVDGSKITTRIEETRIFRDRLEKRIGNLAFTVFSHVCLSSLELVAIAASFKLKYSK